MIAREDAFPEIMKTILTFLLFLEIQTIVHFNSHLSPL